MHGNFENTFSKTGESKIVKVSDIFISQSIFIEKCNAAN